MRPGAFERLNPPWAPATDIIRSGSLQDGSNVKLSTPIMGLKARWEVEHFGFIQNKQFCDRQLKGPFSSWTHRHLFHSENASACTLEDIIECAPYGGKLGELAAGWYIKSELKRVFDYRHRILRHDIELHQQSSGKRRLRVAVSGASGLVGSNLCALLESGGHSVARLVRKRSSQIAGEIAWDPRRGAVEEKKLEGLDAVVHLAGENLAGKRWTPAFKEQLRSSRVDGTNLIASSLARLSNPPRRFICASAIGFYGDRQDEILSEESEAGAGFLPELAKEWEGAATPHVPTVNLRIGVVISPLGGALKKMLLPFLLGLGGPIGHGRQWVSWIALDDLLAAIYFLLYCDLTGPVNAVSPQPVRNLNFSQSLASVVKRPCIFPLPAAVARLAFGEMASETLLASSRVLPNRLQAAGFRFSFPQIEKALRHVLGR